jgi:hypothetical protein
VRGHCVCFRRWSQLAAAEQSIQADAASRRGLIQALDRTCGTMSVRMLCLYQAELNLGAPNHEGNGIHARRVARARRSTPSVHQRMEGPRRGLQLAVRSSRQGSSHPEYVGPPLCSTHLFHGIAWKRWKPCETTIMPGRESRGSRDYARRPPRGRFTSSPNRPSRAHRQADSDTMKRQCSILTRHCTRPPAACESGQFSWFQDALAAGERHR